MKKILIVVTFFNVYCAQSFAADRCKNKFLDLLCCKYKYPAGVAIGCPLTALTVDAGMKASAATSSSACIGCSIASGSFGCAALLALSIPLYCAYQDHTKECERQRAREQALQLQQIRMAIHHAATRVTFINPIYNTYLGEALPTPSKSQIYGNPKEIS